MNKFNACQVQLAVFLFCLAFLPPSLSAGITNEGKETVVIFAEKENGSAQATVFPGQTISIPENAKSLKARSPSSARGDEQTKVRIAQDNGVVLYLNKIGESVTLGEAQPETIAGADYRKATNLGNLAMRLNITKKSGFSETFTILPLQSIILSKDTEAVELTSLGSLRGDEKVDVEVILNSGTVKKLESVGAKVKLDEVET